MGVLPTDRDTADSAADHVTDHNTLHGLNNQLGNFTQSTTEPGSPAVGDLWLDTDESAGTGLSSIIGYAQYVAGSSGTFTAATDLTGLSVTVTVPAGRRLRITGFALMQSTVTGDRMDLRIMEGAVQLTVATRAATASVLEEMTVGIVISPSAGSHTYKLNALRATGTGNVNYYGNTDAPAYILVEDITGTLWPAGQSIGAGTIASEAWTPWTPTLTNSTLGNGTLTAAYVQIGRIVHYRFRFILGSTSAVGSDPRFSLPVNAAAAYSANVDPIGDIALNDTGTATWRGQVWAATATTGRLVYYTAANNSAILTATAPFTWTNTDIITAHGTYEAAS